MVHPKFKLTGRSIQGMVDLHVVVFDCPRCRVHSMTGSGHAFGDSMAVQCQECNGLTVFENRNGLLAEGYSEYFPKWQPTVSADVPLGVAEDYTEAQECLAAGCYRAAVVMSRRMIQSLIKHLWNENWTELPNSHDIRKDIHRLRDEGILTQVLDDVAQSIRVFAVYAAHPKDDGLQSVTSEDARRVVEFCEQILKYTIVLPAEFKSCRASAEVGVSPRRDRK